MIKIYRCNSCKRCIKRAEDEFAMNSICPACRTTNLEETDISEDVWNLLNNDDKDFIRQGGSPSEIMNKNSNVSLLYKDLKDKKEQMKQEAILFKERMITSLPYIPVTTCDMNEEYTILGPVYFQVNNAGSGKVFNQLKDEYAEMLNEMKERGLSSKDKVSGLEVMAAVANVISVFAGGGVDQNMVDIAGNSHQNFDIAFFIATEELKKRAYLMGGDAVIGMRQDIDLDTTGFQHFYLQMYGTAVKLKNSRIPNYEKYEIEQIASELPEL